MKKWIIFVVLTISMVVYAEKLHTDGKFHEKEIIGEYKGMIEIKAVKGQLILYHNWNTPKPLAKLVKAKNGVFRVEYFDKKTPSGLIAWDIKYKTIVDIDDKLNIINDNYEKFK